MSRLHLYLCLTALFLCTGTMAKDFNEKKVVLNLAVMSDTHVDAYYSVPAYKFRSALIQSRDFPAQTTASDVPPDCH